MRKAMVIGLLSLNCGACLFGQEPRPAPEVPKPPAEALVLLRTSEEIVSRGAHMRAWVGTSQDAYLAVFRIDTDGRVRMLYPERPWHENHVQANQVQEISSSACKDSPCAFTVDDDPGQGYVFAVASQSQFEFDSFSDGDYWDYSVIANRGRVTGDPFVEVSAIMERLITQSAISESSYDVASYHVDRRWDYPRFLCYECHMFVRFSAWNPYEEPCPRFQIVRHDSPAHLPASSYEATRVVLSSPGRIEPKYHFEPRIPGRPFITISEHETDSGRARQRAARRHVTAAEVGGRGSIPAPMGRRDTTARTSLRRPTGTYLTTPIKTISEAGKDTARRRLQPRLVRRRKVKPDTSGTDSRSTSASIRFPTAGAPLSVPAKPARRSVAIEPHAMQRVGGGAGARSREERAKTSRFEESPSPNET